MFSDIEFRNWGQQNQLPESTSKYININIREGQPTRIVGGGKRGLSGRYPSKKMGVSIQYETRTVEGPAVYLMENEQDVLEYYDQPNKIKINYLDPSSNKKKGYNWTPDYFVIRTDKAGWEEWKPENKLIDLSEAKPWLYKKDEDGRWRCLPGEEYAAEKGLYFRVRTDKEINWELQSNFIFLDDYLRHLDILEVDEIVIDQIKQIIIDEKGISLQGLLLKAMEMGINSDNVYISLLKEEIYVNLLKYRLAKPEKVPVFITREQDEIYSKIINSEKKQNEQVAKIHLKVGKNLLWDNVKWNIVNIGASNISLKSNGNIISLTLGEIENLISSGEIKGETEKNEGEALINNPALEIFMAASDKDTIIAKERQIYVKKYMQGEFIPIEGTYPSRRTVSGWVKNFKEAIKIYGYGLVGLIPKEKNKGNRLPRIDQRVKELINTYIDEVYESKEQKNKITVYGVFKQKCEELGFDAPSYQTFCGAVNNRPRVESVWKRRGPRAAYQEKPFYWELDYEQTPRHGEFSFNICHLDHTELDIQLISSTNGKSLGRPYLTLMMDAFNRRVLAYYLSFNEPSYRSCMMVLRDCVRRNKRFPQSLVVDNGAEFHSTYFQTLMAFYESELKYRPAAKPKYGSVLERLFGTTNTKIIHNLPGNTQIMKEVRVATKSFNPKNNAKITLEQLNAYLEHFFFELYDTTVHPSLNGLSPREAYEASRIFGEREHKFVEYDYLFKILTLPTTRKGEAKVQPSKGIKVNYRYYWNDKLFDRQVENMKVDVRYDPFNLGVIYALVNNCWIECKCNDYLFFNKLTERESKFISAEMNKTNKEFAKNYLQSSEKTSEFIKDMENQDEYILIKMRADEEKELYSELIEVIKEDHSNKPSTNIQQDLTKNKQEKVESNKQEKQIARVKKEEAVYNAKSKLESDWYEDDGLDDNPLDYYIQDEDDELGYGVY